MFARVSRYRGEAARLLDGFQAVTAELEELEGFSHAYFLTNREHSRAMSITLWDGEEALMDSAERAHQMRTQATEPTDASIESVESYEACSLPGPPTETDRRRDADTSRLGAPSWVGLALEYRERGALRIGDQRPAPETSFSGRR